MRDDYKKVVDEVCRGSDRFTVGLYEACSEVAKRCEALANKPVRELTDDECNKIWTESPDFGDMSKLVRWIVKEYVAKQSEPEEIPFSQEKLDEGGWILRIAHKDCTEDIHEAPIKVTLVRKP